MLKVIQLTIPTRRAKQINLDQLMIRLQTLRISLNQKWK